MPANGWKTNHQSIIGGWLIDCSIQQGKTRWCHVFRSYHVPTRILRRTGRKEERKRESVWCETYHLLMKLSKKRRMKQKLNSVCATCCSGNVLTGRLSGPTPTREKIRSSPRPPFTHVWCNTVGLFGSATHAGANSPVPIYSKNPMGGT